MKNIVRSIAVLALLGSVVSFGFASPNPKCSACKMELSSKKDKTHTVAVKIKGKTYYCCSACNMSKPAKKKAK